MAQRTGADGLIAPRAKVASAGVIPALVAVVALAVSGCGGSSSDPAQSTPGSQASSQAEKSQAKATSPSPGEGEGSADPSSPQSNQGSAAGGKHGPHITLPKGEPEKAPSAAEQAHSTLASIVLESPDLPASASSESELPATYTCNGKDSWPSLKWRGVPPEAAELVLFVIGLQPVNEALFFNWALAGLDPSLEGIDTAQLPKGAILGKNSFGKDGYSICPPSGKAETYIFALYALPRSLSPSRGFDPTTLRKEILALSGNVGLMAASYGA